MLNTRLVREQDAHLHFEVMAYLIRQFGAPPRPPVPSPLHKTPGLEKLSWETLDTRSVYDWAEDHFMDIRSACHMNAFDVALMPAGTGLDSEQVAVSHRLEALAAGNIPYHKTGTTPILYDPRDCAEPGHFATTVILQLAGSRVEGFKPETVLSNLMHRMVTLTAAVYNRQGFVLANLPDHVSAFLTSADDTRAVPHRIVVNTLCFATCLALRVRRQTTEQIIATYGTRMTKSFRRKIRQACRQINSEGETLAVLQMLAEPKVHQRQNPQSVRQIA